MHHSELTAFPHASTITASCSQKLSKNVIIIIQAILKLENCHTNRKYIAKSEIIIANHKSLNVSIVSSHSPHHSNL